MRNLKVIENELVAVYETSTGEKVVYGSELHKVLEVKTPFRTWTERRLSECDALENEDYTTVQICTVAGGMKKKEHIIKLDTAKEMAMLERNEKGKQIRRYFIEVEKKWKNQVLDPRKLPISDQIQILALGNGELVQRIDNVEKSLQEFKEDLPLLAVECEKITKAVKKRGVNCLGGKDSNAYNDKSLRSKVYRDIHNEIKRQFEIDTYKALKRSQCNIAFDIIANYQCPYSLLQAIEDCNKQENLQFR